MEEPRACSPSFSTMTDTELINCAHQRSERAPIDMDAVGIALLAAAALLRMAETPVARERLIGHLYMFDAVCEDMRQAPKAPRAEDGDVIFANRSWVPGKAVEAIARALVVAQGEARKQREDALERAGLGDLATHDHRRDVREDSRVDAAILRT